MHTEVYSAREIARAAGVPEADVSALLARPGAPVLLHGFVHHADAVRIGRELARRSRAPFAESVATADRGRRVIGPLAASSTIHAAGLAVALFLATLDFAPRAQAMIEQRTADPMRLVFVATPGPGGGGGGGGLLQKTPPPKALREGRRKIASPLPERRQPKPIAPAPRPPEPKPTPPLAAEQLPVVVAPIVTAPADARSRAGVLEENTAQSDSRGPGQGGGTGSGRGTGLGSGEGSGVGAGSGGGTGGGPYRPGSGIEPPRLVREVRADYTEDARRQGIRGDVVLEIVVRRDGTVGDARILQGLGGGLNDRAVQAVRQWRFAPATRQGAPVDVLVEVAVEFRLR
jgi:TonB family protein